MGYESLVMLVSRPFSHFGPVSLDELNDRAALQRRTDNKYLVSSNDLARLAEALADEHDVLEIDGDRVFEYDSTYFDTPSLQCFHDHVEDRRPRYKVRTRCYVATGDCFFEVKVKRADGETLKRSVEYDPDKRGSMQPEARELVAATLAECGMGAPDDELSATLVTRFERVTVAARERAERTTFDFGVELVAPGGDAVVMDREHVIVETKTPDGEGKWDRVLHEAGHEPISLSKYRIGTALLRAPGEDGAYAREEKKLFSAA
jgi:VTC domain